MEGSPGNVFGTTSGRGIEAIRASQWERITMASYFRTLGLGVSRVCRVHEVRVDRRYGLQNVIRLDKFQVQAIGKIISVELDLCAQPAHLLATEINSFHSPAPAANSIASISATGDTLTFFSSDNDFALRRAFRHRTTPAVMVNAS
jgi:hypothetical protein